MEIVSTKIKSYLKNQVKLQNNMKRVKKLCVESQHGEGDQGRSQNTNLALDCLSFKQEPEDADRLVRLVPEEVWLLILQKMKAEDLENCINSSPLFWQLRKNNRTVDLFHKVIGIMSIFFEDTKFEDDESEELHNDGAEEEAGQAVEKWKSSVLNCRLVCSEWNKCVEKFYEKADITGLPEFVDELDPRSPLNRIHIPYTNQLIGSMRHFTHPQTFLDRFERSQGVGSKAQPKNPFFGRRVSISMTQDEDISKRENDYNSLQKLLRLFGEEIWYCELHVALRFLTPAQVAARLQEVLTLMPNLKYLNSRTANNFIVPLDMFVSSPLPNLKKLEVLCMERMSSSIANELIRSNSHVKFLSIIHSDVDGDVGRFLSNLEGYSTYQSQDGDQILARFGNQWKLRKLQVSSYGDVGAFQLFQCLQANWADTLTDVQFEDPFSRDESTVMTQSRNLRLALPNAQRLSIESFHAFFLDFALPLQALKHLQIAIHARWIRGHRDWDKVKREQTIELIGFREMMHRSNIWNYFGNLMTIELICKGPNTRDKIFLHSREGSKLVYFRRRFLEDMW